MIQKAELRAGNLVKANASFTGYFKVTEITNDVVQNDFGNALKFDEIGPIILTAEILVDLGFTFGRRFCDDNFYDVKKRKLFLATRRGSLNATMKV